MIACSSIGNFPTAGRLSPPISPQVPIQTLKELTRYCVQDDFEEFTKILEANIIDSDSPTFKISDSSEVMIQAIKLRRSSFARELLRRGLPLLPEYVYEAVKANAKDILLTSLFQDGWDINQPMGVMHPPILSNALDDIEMTTWLLDHGADPNRRCYIDLTPLSCAVEHAPLPIVDLLLKRGGDVAKGQVLHHALDRKSDTVDILKRLIIRGAPVNAIFYRDHQPSWNMNFFMGETPLHKAVYLRKVDAIHYLLSQGADPNIKDVRDQTVIQIADETIRTELSQSSSYLISPKLQTQS